MYKRQYLQFRKFAVRTDHSSLRWLQTLKKPEQQLFRWLTVLQGFDFQGFYRRGIDHGNADGLSRRPCDENCKHCLKREAAEEKDEEEEIGVCHVNRVILEHPELTCARTAIFNNSPWDDQLIITAQKNDPDFAPVYEAMLREEKPSPEVTSDWSRASQYLSLIHI